MDCRYVVNKVDVVDVTTFVLCGLAVDLGTSSITQRSWGHPQVSRPPPGLGRELGGEAEPNNRSRISRRP